jgi:hypothetical protein
MEQHQTGSHHNRVGFGGAASVGISIQMQVLLVGVHAVRERHLPTLASLHGCDSETAAQGMHARQQRFGELDAIHGLCACARMRVCTSLVYASV